MPLDFTTTKPLDDAAIRNIVREAELAVADGTEPKLALVAAVMQHIGGEFAQRIEAGARGVLEFQQMMGGTEADIAAGLDDLLAPHAITPLYPIGDLEANLAARSYQMGLVIAEMDTPAPGDYGKWLSAYGIVAEHITGISGAKAAPPAPASAPPPPPPPLPPAAPGAPPPPPPAPPAPAAASNEPGNMRDAVQMFFHALDFDDKAMALRLGVSAGSMRNWKGGKTTKVRLSIDQMRVFLAEVDVRVSQLHAAAAKFAEAVGK